MTFLQELQNAGLPVNVDSVSETERIASFTRRLSDEESELYHDIRDPRRVQIRNIESSSKLNIIAIPQWATWTEQEVLSWLESNIGTPLQTQIPNLTTLLQTRTVLVQIQDIMKKQYQVEESMARMIIALRNKTFPDLEGS